MTLQDDLIELARLKERQKDDLEALFQVEKRIVDELERLNQKTVSANHGDLTGTLVKGTTMSIDEDRLKKALGAPMWRKVTRQVLDKERLEAHIVTGTIDANVVAGVSTEKDRKPFIKVSGSFRPKKTVVRRAVNTKNSSGGTKPAAKKRVVKKPTK